MHKPKKLSYEKLEEAYNRVNREKVELERRIIGLQGAVNAIKAADSATKGQRRLLKGDQVYQLEFADESICILVVANDIGELGTIAKRICETYGSLRQAIVINAELWMTDEPEAEAVLNVDLVKYPHNVDGVYYSDKKVLQSGAGYYIGTTCWDPKEGFEEPGSRESGYFVYRDDAERCLREGSFDVRECDENDAAYASGLPRPKTKAS